MVVTIIIVATDNDQQAILHVLGDNILLVIVRYYVLLSSKIGIHVDLPINHIGFVSTKTMLLAAFVLLLHTKA